MHVGIGACWRQLAAQSDSHPRTHPSGPTPSSIIKLNALKNMLDAPGAHAH
jgi:hypothetical protein